MIVTKIGYEITYNQILGGELTEIDCFLLVGLRMPFIPLPCTFQVFFSERELLYKLEKLSLQILRNILDLKYYTQMVH